MLRACVKCGFMFAGINCPECAKARTARWYLANYDRAKATQEKYRLNNKEKIRLKTARWVAKNPDKVKASKEKRKVKIYADVKKWRKENPEAVRLFSQNRRARKKAAVGKLSKGLTAKLFELQKGKCPCCGKLLERDFHLDHIMPLIRGGSNTDDNMQLLKSTCNHQKNAKHPIDFMQSRGFLL